MAYRDNTDAEGAGGAGDRRASRRMAGVSVDHRRAAGLQDAADLERHRRPAGMPEPVAGAAQRRAQQGAQHSRGQKQARGQRLSRRRRHRARRSASASATTSRSTDRSSNRSASRRSSRTGGGRASPVGIGRRAATQTREPHDWTAQPRRHRGPRHRQGLRGLSQDARRHRLRRRAAAGARREHRVHHAAQHQDRAAGAARRGFADREIPGAQSRRRHPSRLLRGRRHPRRPRPAQGRRAPACWATATPKIGAHDKPVLFLHPKDFCGTLVELEQA